MKKILIVMPSMEMGGAEKSLLSLLYTIDYELMKEKKIEIDLLVANDTGVLMKQIPVGVNIMKAPYSLRNFAMPKAVALKNSKIKLDVYIQKIFWKFTTLFADKNNTPYENYWKANKWTIQGVKEKYDICLAYMNGLATYYAIDKVKAAKKYVWVHNEYEKLNYTDSFEKYYFEKADGIVTISQICVDSIIKHFPDLRDKVHMIENISSSKLLKEQAEEFTPAEYDDVDGKIILSIGRLFEQKGFDIGIKAASILREKKIAFKWFIIGVGEKKAELEQLIQSYGLEEQVCLLGLRENPYPYIKNADIFFQPSRFEGKSITLDEAKIFAKPIVVSNYDTVFDSIENGKNGIICELNPQALADGIIKLVQNEEMMRDLSATLQNEKTSNEDEIEKYYDLML